MFESIKNFSVSDVQLDRSQNEDMDFSKVEIWALADGNNSHRNPLSNDVLKRDSDTFRGKFIVAKYNKLTQDCEGHEIDEAIIGYVDPNEDIEFKSKVVDGIEKEFVVVKGLISKIYSKDIVDMFRVNNERAVSCEFSCSLQYEEDEYGKAFDEYGNVVDNPILKYHIHAITILGLQVNPSVAGTEIKIKQFAQKFNEQKPTLKELAQQRNKMLSNDKTISKTKLDLYKDNDNEEDSMEFEDKNFSQDVEDKEKDIVMEDTEEMSEDVAEMEETTEEMSEETEEMSEDVAEMSEPEEADDEDVEDEDEKEMSEEVSDEEEKEEDKEEMACGDKKFSLDAYADAGAIMAMLENETEDNIELCNRLIKEMSAVEIIETVISLSKENAELKKFQKDRLELDKQTKLATIMASVKDDLEPKKFSELQSEGLQLDYNELDGFANKVKAFAYESTKRRNFEKAEEDMLVYGSASMMQDKYDSQDVFDRISRM